MTDYAKLFRDIEAQDNIRAATLAITPEGEIPTVDFEGAPETAKAVAHAVNPQQNAVQWDELGSVEKVLNSVEGGWHNRQKGLAAQAVVTAAREAEDGLASLVDPEDDEYRFLTENELTGLQDAVKNNSMSRAYKAEQNEAKTNAIYEYLDLSKQDKNYPMPDAVRSAAEKTEGKSFTEALPAYLKELGKDPIDSLTYMVGSSLGTIAPALITSVGAGAGLNLLRMNSTARAVQAALMGHGSYDAEVGGYINEYFQEKGYDLSNRETWEQALANEDLQELTEQAKRRGTVVGLFDAAGAFIAPVRLNPSNAFRTLRTAADGAQQVTQPASRMARIGKGVESLTLQTGIQSGLGMAGEALGQLVNNNPINWGDVFAEGIAEFGTGPFEVVSLSLSANANYRRETAIAQEAQRADKAWNDIATAVNTVAKQLPNDGSLEQWAQSVGKDANVFAFAQDFIENGELEKIRAVNPELAQRIEEAAGQKEDVTIPVADVLSIAAKDETVARSLLQDVRTTADGMSPRQAQDFLKNGKKEAVQAFDAILKRAKPDVELRREIQVETDKIEQELEQTGATKEVAQMQVLPWASWLAVRAKQTGLKPKAIMDTLRLRIRGEQTSTDGALNQSVSTALPSDAAVHPQGKNKKPLYPDPSYFHQWASFDEAKKNPNWLTTAVAKMRQIPGIKGATKGMRNADNMSEKIVERLTDNLVWLHNKVPEQLRQRAKLWYDGGRKAAETWAVRYGLRPRQTAAIIAIFSPQTDWFANMSMAERLLDIYFSARRQKADQAMLDWFNTEQGKKYNRADVEGKSLEELIQAKDFKKAAIWVRAYDKAHNPEARHALSPEGGTLDVVQNKSGKGPVKTSFMANKRIEDALSIIVDGSVDNVFKRIGSDFKVRNFYNNIFNPNNLNAVTIDTHAVGAGLFSVVSANDSVVADNFGNPGNATSGQNGTYPIYFEAYRRAAQKLGIQPREMQSITWEAIRALFDASAKTNLRPQVEAVWKRVDKGEITADQAREEIFDLAGGFSKTAWEDKDFNDKITQTYDRRHVKLYDDIVQPEPEPVLSMEVAPDPNDLEAVAQWNQLTEEDKLSVTQETLPWVLDQVALLTKTHIDLPQLQRGGYKGTPNYSMCCEVEEGSDIVKVAQILGTVLRQESIMVVTSRQEASTEASKLIRIKLPEGYTTEQIDNLYNVLDGIRDAKGERLLEGHSTVNGIMTISVDPAKIEEIEASLTEALAKHEDEFVYSVKDGYVGFIEPLEGNQNAAAQNDTGRRGTIREGTPVSAYDNLRRETAEMVARKIRERLQARAEGGQAVGNVKGDPLFQRGYIGRSESVRASEARQEGQKPLSAWTKKAIIEAMKANDAPEELIRKAEAQPLWVLQQSVLSKTSWHHTGPNYQKTDFYGINDDYSDAELGASWVSERIDEAAKAYSTDYTEEAKKFAEFALSDFLAFDYYKDHQLGIFRKDRDIKRYDAYKKALDSVEEEAHKRAEEFRKHRNAQSSQPLTQRDVARALEQLGYHGSPYLFDRFTLSHIGSGEGAQAHGWGLYFALNKLVAEGYRDTLSTGGRTTAYLNGKALADHEPLDGTVQERVEWSVGKTLKFLNSPLKNGSRYSDDKVREAIRQNIDVCESILKSWSSPDFARDFARDALTELKKMEANLDQYAYSSIYEKNGRVYTVEIPDDDVMLKEQERFDAQPPAVQEALRKIWDEIFGANTFQTIKGKWLAAVKRDTEDRFFGMEETYKAFLKLAEEEGPSAFTDLQEIREHLSKALRKDATKAHKINLENGYTESTVEEAEEGLWSELSSTTLLAPATLAHVNEQYNLFELYSKYKAEKRYWRRLVNNMIPTEDLEPIVVRAIKSIAKEEGPLGFRDEGTFKQNLKKHLLNDAKRFIKRDPEEAAEIAGLDDGETITPERLVDEWANNLIAMDDYTSLYREAVQNAPMLIDTKINTISERAVGGELYRAISSRLGLDKKASLLLNKYGVKGIRYNGRRDGECAVVWDEESIRILDALEQAKRSEGPRGTYMPQNTSDASSLSGVMTLMQTRDKSTFLHESAHAWLDADTMLAKGIAERVLKGEEINAGEMALLKNLGGFFRWGQEERTIDLGVTDDIKTVAQAVIRWSQMDISDQRMMHELFAEGFEAYLLEGTAPNTEMLTVFGKFKRWLMDIYARATRQPRPISREVRKLYDLMFATEQQAEDTQTRLGLKAMFEAADAKKLGMTDEEVQAYNDLQERAQLETEGLVAKAVHGVMRIFGKVRKEEIERIDKEALKRKEAELLEAPRYRAVALLNSRQVVLDASQMQGFDTDTVDALDAHGWISHNGGVSPAVLASMAGTTDTVGLIGDILEIDLVGDAHEEALRILAYENRKADGEEGVFSELHANLAAYNKTRSRLIAAEFNAIARMIGKQQILTSAAREYAIERIGEMRVSDIHPYVFINAEQRCAREAQEALKKGDYAACLEAKRGQVVNHEMARAALEAQERQVKAIRMVRRGLKSKTIHPKYQQLLKALIDAHAISSMTAAEREEFAKIPNLDAVQVSKLLKTLEDNGTPIDGLQEFLQTHEHVNDMTAYTAQDFFGVVKQVIAIGRNVLTQHLTDIAESVAEVVSEGKAKIAEAADAQKRPVIEFPRMPITRKERALAKVSEFLLSHVKIQALCRILDRNKDGGFFWNLFIRSANERANFEAEERARCAQELKEKLLPVFKTSQDEDPIVVPGFDKPFTHGMRLAVALNLGNESNKQRLIMNEPRFTQEALQAIMDNLTEADWRAVEAIWQLFESFRPAIAAKQERVYGIEPEWITYTPFTVRTAEGKTITVSGGYYPVKYDPVASLRADKLTDAEAAEQEMKGAYQSATTRRSFTKSRFEGDIVGRPLRLDLSALYEGLNDVIHDLAWHEWLIDTKRVLDGVDGDTSGLRAAIKERYGYQITKELEEWRKDIALGGRSQGASDTLSFVTRNIGVATMGYSFMSAFVQLTGVGYVIPRTGTAAFAVALGKYLTNPAKVRRFVNSQSQAMLLRSQTQFKELAQIRNRLSQGKGVSAWMYDHAYSLLAFAQGIVDSLCWQAAYERFNREGHSGDELVALCDQVVIDTQSSGNVSDLSRIERERGLSQIFTIFYTWMNAALNLAITTQFGEENRFKRVATMLWICAVMPCIEQAYRESLKPTGDDDDDKDETLTALALGQLGNIVEYNMGLLTVAREFSSAVKGVVADDAVYNYSGPAGLRLLSNFNKGAQAIANPTEEKILKAVIDLSGSFLGLPSVQINNTIKGARAIESGQVEGVDAAKALVFGFKGKINE